MRHLIIFLPICILFGCNNSAKRISAIELNDSAVAITKHFEDTSKYEQAIALLNQAIKQDSTIFDLYKNKYFFEVTLGNYKSALNTNNRLIAFRPDSADLFFQAATFEQFFQDTILAQKSFERAAILYKKTLDTMNAKSPYYFYDWRLWACSMIMIGQESIIHEFLKENCTNKIDSTIYHPEMLSKTKQELKQVMNKQLTNLQYRR